MNGRRHQDVRLAAGVSEHQTLVAGAFVLVAVRIDALGNVDGLGMHVDVDGCGLPMKPVLLITDFLDRGPGALFQHILGNGLGAAHFSGENDAVGGAERFHGYPRQRVGG